MGKYAIVVVILLQVMLLMSAVCAADAPFSVSSQIVTGDIFSDEMAEMEVTIVNNGPDSTFQVYSNDPRWLISTTPVQPMIKNGESRTLRVYLDPSSSIKQSGNYGIPLVIKSVESERTQVIDLIVLIKSDRFRQYAPSVSIDVEVGEEGLVDPRNPVTVYLRISNKNPLKYDSLVIGLNSELITDAYITNLSPNGDIYKKLTYTINPQTPPNNYSMVVTMTSGNKSIGVVRTVYYEVVPVFAPFVAEKDIQENFLKKEWYITFTNNGNVEKQEQVLLPLSGSSLWFTDASHPYTLVKHEGKDAAAFTVSLQPGQTTKLEVVTNYRPFIITASVLIILIVLGIGGYYAFRSPVIVSREIKTLAGSGDESSKIKVLLHVCNRTGKSVDDIKVFERLPHITQVEDSFEVGTIKPAKVVKSPNKGTLVRWDLGTLDPYEERIITYKLQSKLSILGELSLAPTIVKYARGETMHKVEFADVDKPAA